VNFHYQNFILVRLVEIRSKPPLKRWGTWAGDYWDDHDGFKACGAALTIWLSIASKNLRAITVRKAIKNLLVFEEIPPSPTCHISVHDISTSSSSTHGFRPILLNKETKVQMTGLHFNRKLLLLKFKFVWKYFLSFLPNNEYIIFIHQKGFSVTLLPCLTLCLW
jgi:hypothetical protein